METLLQRMIEKLREKEKDTTNKFCKEAIGWLGKMLICRQWLLGQMMNSLIGSQLLGDDTIIFLLTIGAIVKTCERCICKQSSCWKLENWITNFGTLMLNQWCLVLSSNQSIHYCVQQIYVNSPKKFRNTNNERVFKFTILHKFIITFEYWL